MRRALVVGVTMIVGCQPQTAKPADSLTLGAGDTLRGVLVLEGSDPYPIAAMRTSGGRIIVDGGKAPINKLSNLDVWLRGKRTSPDRFQVEGYRVRSANGVKAWDGILRSSPSGYSIELEDGAMHVVKGAPAALAALAGSRVWLTENPDGSLREYGVL